MFKPFIFPIIALSVCIVSNIIDFLYKKLDKKSFMLNATMYGIGVISCALFLLETESLLILISAFVMASIALVWIAVKVITSIVARYKNLKKEIQKHKQEHSRKDNGDKEAED